MYGSWAPNGGSFACPSCLARSTIISASTAIPGKGSLLTITRFVGPFAFALTHCPPTRGSCRR